LIASRRRFLAAAAPLAVAACTNYGASSPVMTFPPDIPFFFTGDDTVAAMLGGAAVGPNDVVCDLGCGDGRIVIAAAYRYGARGFGVDIDPVRIGEARYYADKAGVSARTRFEVADIFATDVSAASVVTLYLSVAFNIRLRPQLWRQLRPGSRVVSNKFDMGPDYPPERTLRVGDDRVFFWTVA
jgi:ubiquinone/menaquinone biosynthesis C-methylase UbiE